MMQEKYSKLIDKIEKLLEVLVIFLLFAAFAVVFLQVIARYLLGGSQPWMEESGRYFIIWMSFLGSVIALRHRNHMHLDVFEMKFSEKNRYYLNLFLDVLLIAFLCVLFYSSVIYTINNQSSISTALRISMSWIYLSSCVGTGLMLLFEIELFWLRLKTKKCHPEADIGRKEDTEI